MMRVPILLPFAGIAAMPPLPATAATNKGKLKAGAMPPLPATTNKGKGKLKAGKGKDKGKGAARKGNGKADKGKGKGKGEGKPGKGKEGAADLADLADVGYTQSGPELEEEHEDSESDTLPLPEMGTLWVRCDTLPLPAAVAARKGNGKAHEGKGSGGGMIATPSVTPATPPAMSGRSRSRARTRDVRTVVHSGHIELD
jgi:hypothetical protein